jgi:hypothetical protein
MLTARLLICLGIVALTTTPALCDQFFIVQDPDVLSNNGRLPQVIPPLCWSEMGPTETRVRQSQTCEELLPVQETSNSNRPGVERRRILKLRPVNNPNTTDTTAS